MTETIKDNETLLELKPVKHKKHLSRRTSEILFVCFMLLIPIIQFIIFWIVPNIDSILMGFQKEGDSSSFTMANFKKFFSEFTSGKDMFGHRPEIITAIVNSLIYFAISIFFCTPLVIFFSYVLFRKVPFSGLFRVIFYLPSIIGATVTATLFKAVTDVGGPVFTLLENMGLFNDNIKLIGLYNNYTAGNENLGFTMIIIYSIWTCVGINMILFHGAMRRIPNEIFESANVDGVGFFRQFIDIVIPLIWPTIATLIIFSLSGIFVSYGTVMLLTPNNKFATMIGYYIFSRVDNGELVYPAAVGLIFTIIGLPFVLLVRWALNKIGSNVEY